MSHLPAEGAPGSGRRAPHVVFAVALLLVPLLAACGSDGESSATADTAAQDSTMVTEPSGGTAAGDDFAACLAEQGVELAAGGAGSGGPPGFGGGTPPTDGEGGGQPSLPEGVDADAMQEAMEACGDLAPAGGFGGGDLSQEDQEAMRVYQSCLADNGVEMGGGAPPPADESLPDDANATGPEGSFPSPDMDDPEVATAFETCEPLQPEGFGGRSGAPSDDETTTDTTEEVSS